MTASSCSRVSSPSSSSFFLLFTYFLPLLTCCARGSVHRPRGDVLHRGRDTSGESCTTAAAPPVRASCADERVSARKKNPIHKFSFTGPTCTDAIPISLNENRMFARDTPRALCALAHPDCARSHLRYFSSRFPRSRRSGDNLEPARAGDNRFITHESVCTPSLHNPDPPRSQRTLGARSWQLAASDSLSAYVCVRVRPSPSSVRARAQTHVTSGKMRRDSGR